MDTNKSSLLPYVMDMLSREPQLCTTFDDLVKNIKDIVLEEHINRFGSLKRAVEFALEAGVNLGIISLTHERFRIPFNFRRSPPKTRVPLATRISPRSGRRAIKQRMPTSTAAKLVARKKRTGRKSKKTAGAAVRK